MYGEVDPNTFIVRINVAKHKRERQSLIDTLVHEELHILFPRFGEAMIRLVECVREPYGLKSCLAWSHRTQHDHFLYPGVGTTLRHPPPRLFLTR